MKTQWIDRSIWMMTVLLATLLVGCGESRLTSSTDGSGGGSGSYTVRQTRTVSGVDIQRLQAQTINGSISFETSPSVSSVTVEVTKVIRGPSVQMAVDFERILETRVEKVGDEVRIRTEWPRNADGYDATVDYKIVAPEGLTLALGTVNGSILVDGKVSEMAAATVNGGVEIRGTSGPVALATVNGAVKADLAHLSGEGRFATVNGAIAVVIEEMTSPIVAATTNGSVTVTLASGFVGHLDAQTTTGTVRSDFTVREQRPVRVNRLVGNIGEGQGPTIQLRSLHGNLSLKKG